MPTKLKSSQSKGASSSTSRFHGRNMLTTLRTKLRRTRTGSVDDDPGDKLSDLPVSAKCATLPARVSSEEPCKTKTLFWMVGVVDELEGSLPPTATVTREDSEESVDSGFHQQTSKLDDQEKIAIVPASTEGSKIYDVATVERAFGPLKDVGRWYSTYSSSRQLEESRYVHRPLRLQQSSDEDERLTSRPLPPIPKSDNSRSPPLPVRNEEVLYERVEQRMLGSNGLCLGLRNLSNHGWYWGPITRVEAEERLAGTNDGTFLVRDSSDDRYLLSLSFRSQSKTLHTRIEYSNGYFSFYSFPDSDTEGYQSVVELIESSMQYSQDGVFCFSRARALGSPAVPVRLLKPFSRFNHVRSLQHYCRFVIRQSIRFDLIRQLPLPRHVHGYLEQSQF